MLLWVIDHHGQKIMEMEERGYFPEGKGRAPGTETVPEPNDDEVVV
jgi:hypothetical protein